ncbi:MAG: MarR family transcriptional regulator [Paracoccaceae bacterium]|nr:MAG: MarR family transcriptional regulator [Paracoccaceae bacterium]
MGRLVCAQTPVSEWGALPRPVNGVACCGAQRYRGLVTDAASDPSPAYVLDDQVGYVLRRVTQRHLAIFAQAIPEVTTTQFAVLARLCTEGPMSQNQLGRAVALDAATVKGVVDRLRRQALAARQADPGDRRRLTVAATAEGQALFASRMADALAVSARTLEPLTEDERRVFLSMLARLG